MAGVAFFGGWSLNDSEAWRGDVCRLLGEFGGRGGRKGTEHDCYWGFYDFRFFLTLR